MVPLRTIGFHPTGGEKAGAAQLSQEGSFADTSCHRACRPPFDLPRFVNELSLSVNNLVIDPVARHPSSFL